MTAVQLQVVVDAFAAGNSFGSVVGLIDDHAVRYRTRVNVATPKSVIATAATTTRMNLQSFRSIGS